MRICKIVITKTETHRMSEKQGFYFIRGAKTWVNYPHVQYVTLTKYAYFKYCNKKYQVLK